jgi:short-subunit dehydrogenase
LGYELALRYADKDNRLFLLARREDRLQELSSKLLCQNYLYQVDVTDTTKLQTILKTIMTDNKIDIIIANAGISLGHSDRVLVYDDFKKIIDVNFLSIIALLEEVVPHMIEQKSGKIVLVSSMASYVTMPSSIAYSTSKRALSSFAEGLRNQLKKYGIKVYDIRPGFIKSEMTDKNSFSMPFLLDTKSGVDKIIYAINHDKFIYAFPLRFWFIVKTISLLPQKIKDYIIQKI